MDTFDDVSMAPAQLAGFMLNEQVCAWFASCRQRSLDAVSLQGDDMGEAEASKLIEKYEPYRKGVLETGVVARGEP